MTRNQLKWLAIFAMLIDHLAWAFVPTASLPGQMMHFIGRLTAPTMAFFIAEGYCHTRSVKKYALRLAVFALLSWVPFSYFEFGQLPVGIADGEFYVNPATGVIYTLLLGLLAIWLWDKGRCPQWCKLLGTIGLCILALIGDWAFFTVLWCLFFYLFRDAPKKKWIAYAVVSLLTCMPMLFSTPWWKYLFMVGVFLVPPLLQFGYHGEAGRRSAVGKWFFYLFYPLHLLILGLLKWEVFGK